jgi:hypothetical protein
MSSRDPQDILRQLGHTTLKIDGFFLRRTGFVANQTVLKLGEFNVNCIPASFGLPEARFLAVLAPTEISLFSKFKEGLNVLVLSFDDPDSNDIERFHLKVAIDDFVPVPERRNVCQIVVTIKSIPPDFLRMLGDYLDVLDQRRQEWEAWGTETLEASADLLRAAGLTAAAKLIAGLKEADVSIVAFHTKAIRVSPSADAALGSRGGAPVQLRVVLRGQAVTLDGRIGGDDDFVPEFSHDWLQAVEHARLARDLRSRAKKGA